MSHITRHLMKSGIRTHSIDYKSIALTFMLLVSFCCKCLYNIIISYKKAAYLLSLYITARKIMSPNLFTLEARVLATSLAKSSYLFRITANHSRGEGIRTLTPFKGLWILSPLCLPFHHSPIKMDSFKH